MLDNVLSTGHFTAPEWNGFRMDCSRRRRRRRRRTRRMEARKDQRSRSKRNENGVLSLDECTQRMLFKSWGNDAIIITMITPACWLQALQHFLQRVGPRVQFRNFPIVMEGAGRE